MKSAIKSKGKKGGSAEGRARGGAGVLAAGGAAGPSMMKEWEDMEGLVAEPQPSTKGWELKGRMYEPIEGELLEEIQTKTWEGKYLAWREESHRDMSKVPEDPKPGYGRTYEFLRRMKTDVVCEWAIEELEVAGEQGMNSHKRREEKALVPAAGLLWIDRLATGAIAELKKRLNEALIYGDDWRRRELACREKIALLEKQVELMTDRGQFLEEKVSLLEEIDRARGEPSSAGPPPSPPTNDSPPRKKPRGGDPGGELAADGGTDPPSAPNGGDIAAIEEGVYDRVVGRIDLLFAKLAEVLIRKVGEHLPQEGGPVAATTGGEERRSGGDGEGAEAPLPPPSSQRKKGKRGEWGGRGRRRGRPLPLSPPLGATTRPSRGCCPREGRPPGSR